jgi:hypothetical protein
VGIASALYRSLALLLFRKALPFLFFPPLAQGKPTMVIAVRDSL